eukprot:gene6728-4823_t
MSSKLQDAFRDEGKAICSVFFTTTDLTEKTWYDFESLAKADDVTFWTVITHHPRLPAVLHSALAKMDHAHHSVSPATRRSVTKAQIKALASAVFRFACDTEACSKAGVDITGLGRRINTLLPLKQFIIFNGIVVQSSGSFASLAGYCLHLLSPAYLSDYNIYCVEWRESLDQVVRRCVKELGRGRYQRLSGDILLLFEQTYRAVKQMWAVLMTCPFVADYLSLSSVLRAMRIVTDVIAPMLQHFLMTCETLASRRDVLSKANAGIINAALQTSTALLLFRRFSIDEKQPLQFLCPPILHKIDERLMETADLYTRGHPRVLLLSWTAGDGRCSAGKSLHALYDALAGSTRSETDRRVGEVLLVLMNAIAESGDFASAAPKRQRFFELLLMELVNQGVGIDDLLQRGLVQPSEAEELGASQQAVMCALAGISLKEESKPVPPAPVVRPKSPPKRAFEEGSLGAVVQDVFPHFSATGITAALQHYNNDLEQLITDASIDNLPPHLVELLRAHHLDTALAEETAALQSAAHDDVQLEFSPAQLNELASEEQQHLTNDDFDDTLRLTDFSLFWDMGDMAGFKGPARDGGEDAGGEEEEEEETDYVTFNADEVAPRSGFDVSEEMREKIRILNEIMYEDEMDDGQLEAQQQQWNRNHAMASKKGGTYSSSDDDVDEMASPTAGVPVEEPGADGEAAAPLTTATGRPLYNLNRPPSRSDYDNKRFNVYREKDHKAHVKEKQAARATREEGSKPSYAAKEKTVKKSKKVRGGKAEMRAKNKAI